MDQFATSSPGLPKEAFREPTRAKRGEASELEASCCAWAALAGALLAVAAWLRRRAGRRSRATIRLAANASSTTQPEPTATEPVARRHAHANRRRRVGARMRPRCITGSCCDVGDQVALESGMAKVTYDCGAEVVLAGPVRLLAAQPDGRLSGVGPDHGQRAAAGVFVRHSFAAGRHGRPGHVVRRRGRRSTAGPSCTCSKAKCSAASRASNRPASATK